MLSQFFRNIIPDTKHTATAGHQQQQPETANCCHRGDHSGGCNGPTAGSPGNNHQGPQHHAHLRWSLQWIFTGIIIN